MSALAAACTRHKQLHNAGRLWQAPMQQMGGTINATRSIPHLRYRAPRPTSCSATRSMVLICGQAGGQAGGQVKHGTRPGAGPRHGAGMLLRHRKQGCNARHGTPRLPPMERHGRCAAQRWRPIAPATNHPCTVPPFMAPPLWKPHAPCRISICQAASAHPHLAVFGVVVVIGEGQARQPAEAQVGQGQRVVQHLRGMAWHGMAASPGQHGKGWHGGMRQPAAWQGGDASMVVG